MIEPTTGNVADLLRANAVERPDAVALVDAEGRQSWAELDAAVDGFVGALAARGLGAGDRVALALGTSVPFVVAYLGTLRAGMVAVPLNTGLTAGELARVLAGSGSRLVLTGPDAVDAVREAVAGIGGAGDGGPEVVVVHAPALAGETAYEDLVAAGSGTTPAGGGSGEDLAVLLFTSGASAQPRAAMLSHRALLSNIGQTLAIEPAPTRPDDVVLGVLPLFHVFGLNAVLGTVLGSGATLVLSDRFDPAGSLELIRTHAVTNVPAAPPMLVAWAGRDDLGEAFRTVRVIVTGSQALPPAVGGEIETATGVTMHEGYGLTETSPTVTTTFMSERRKPGSIGRPLPGVEVKLVDEDGVEVEEEGDPGELMVRGANLFSGYWPDGQVGPGPDGWWPTGDVALADEDGDLFLVDRIKDLVIVSGFNVYPHEVEEVIMAHPDVAEVAVVPVPHPYTGEAVKAYVVARPGATLTTDAVVAHARTRLARFKCPTIVEILPALPHTGTGKVAKGSLRDLDRAATLARARHLIP